MESLQETKPSTFDVKFKNPREFKFPEGKVKVVDILPDQLSGGTAIVVAPGWSENYSTYKDTLRFISQEGRRALSFDYSPKGKAEKDSQYPDIELKKAKLLLDALAEKGLDKVDVIAHSEGAINVLIAAMIDPSRFRNIVLDKPAGLIGEDSKIGLISRFVKLMKQETQLRPWLSTDPNAALTAGTRVTAYLAEHPIRVMKELDALTSYEITELMQDLSDRGIMFSVISGVDDPLFPVSKQIENMRKLKETGRVLPIEGYYSVADHDKKTDFGHNALSLRPEKHTALALNALDNLQWKREKSGNNL